MDNVQWTMDNEGVHFVDVFSFFIRRGDPVWSPVTQYGFANALRATTRGRPYEFQIIFRRKIPSLSIVNCQLSISNRSVLSVKYQFRNNPHRFAEPPVRGHGKPPRDLHEGVFFILYSANALLNCCRIRTISLISTSPFLSTSASAFQFSLSGVLPKYRWARVMSR